MKTIGIALAAAAVLIIINENLDAAGLPNLRSLVFTGGAAA
jgi:hypothetical protein